MAERTRSRIIKPFREYFLHRNGIIKKEFARWYAYASIEIPYKYNATIIDAYNLCWRKNSCLYMLYDLSEEERIYNLSIVENAIKNKEISFVPNSFRRISMQDEISITDSGKVEEKIICEINLLTGRKVRNLFLIIGLKDFMNAEFIDDSEKLIIEIGENI